jgi:tetratricopeptide (TPR) repeat protein
MDQRRVSSAQDPVSRQVLLDLLTKRGEDDHWDFKETLGDLTTNSARAALTKHVLAFSNTAGGGNLVLGVKDKTYELVGLEPVYKLDTTLLNNSLTKYTKAYVHISTRIDSFSAAELDDASWVGSKLFGLVYVHPGTSIAVTSCPYQGLFNEGDILVRRGAQSVRADQAAVDALIAQRAKARSRPRGLSSNLPPREEVASRFIGRVREINSLWQWFLEPEYRKWLLAGGGGKGKTAIAYEFASRVKSLAPEGLDYVLWMSAKRERLGLGRVEQIDQPDFWDLPSLLDAILAGYGFAEDLSLTFHDKQERVLELLDKFPALFVVDDLDSLDSQDAVQAQAIDFLWERVGRTATKVLFTSRENIGSQYFSAITQVSGLEPPDDEAFLRSRIDAYGLDAAAFTTTDIADILKTTDRSPLYIQALLWLCTVESPKAAIRSWRKQQGDAARRYSLERQVEKLDDEAKKALLACCVAQGPISLAEIRLLTGCGERAAGVIRQIQRLYLMSLPRLIEQDQRFDVDSNTRLLILDVFRGSAVLGDISLHYSRMSEDTGPRSSSEKASLIRQAQALQHMGRSTDALQVLKAALDVYPDDPDLVGYMAVVYQGIGRVVDARGCFQQAAELRCRREWMYTFWAKMEYSQNEYARAAEIAELGQAETKPTVELSYWAGLARSKLGAQHAKTLDNQSAHAQFVKADAQLRRSRELFHVDHRSHNSNLRCDVYEALVVNTERLLDNEAKLEGRDRRSSTSALRRNIFDFLDEWGRQACDDASHSARVQRQRRRLTGKYTQSTQ